MTMPMEKLEVVELILTALRAGDLMVDFQQISILKKQLTMGTFPFLSLE
jgi:hypothetical protein